MLLVLTYSEDVTFDALAPHLKGVPFFRFNVDLWRDYRWEITASGYRLENKIGLACNEHNVRAVYVRKLIFSPPYVDVPAGGSEESWLRAQLTQIIYGIRDLAVAKGRLALVHPSRFASKIRQMRLAAAWFPVPEWNVFYGVKPASAAHPAVVKTFAGVPIEDGAHVLVKEVNPEQLSAAYPWFTQRLMEEASHDVTSVYVNGQIFSYELERAGFEGVDCRVPSLLEDAGWRPCGIEPSEADGIRKLMAALGLTFGRFDFLRVRGRLWFLEVNPNGQWGWLDPDGSNGLYRAVADEILKVWQRP